MTSTLEILTAKYNKAALTLEEVREEAFKDISTKHLRRLIREGKVKLPTRQTGRGQRAPMVVLVADLAAWLDALPPSNTPAAHQAA